MKCLELKPEDRFQSAKDLCDALNESLDVGPQPTASVKEYLLKQFAEEFKNEAELLLQIQKVHMTQGDITCKNEPMANSTLPHPPSQQTTPVKTNVVTTVNTSGYIVGTNQTANTTVTDLCPLEQNIVQLSVEKTVIMESPTDNGERTAVIDRTNLNLSAPGPERVTRTKVLSTEALQHNSSLNVLVNSRDVTQTDYAADLL